MMGIQIFAGGDFQENGYLVVSGASGPGIVIDPGAAAPFMAQAIMDEGIELEAIVLTHAHLDHVEGVPVIRDEYPEVPIYLNSLDRMLYDGVESQARAFNLPMVGPLPAPDRELTPGETLTVGDLRFEIRHAPGHAPGHVILYSEAEKVCFVGDVVFQGAIGRADLPGGNFHQLMESIRTQVLSLPDDVRLLTGHGPETTVGWERRTNPFLVGHYGGELA